MATNENLIPLIDSEGNYIRLVPHRYSESDTLVDITTKDPVPNPQYVLKREDGNEFTIGDLNRFAAQYPDVAYIKNPDGSITVTGTMDISNLPTVEVTARGLTPTDQIQAQNRRIVAQQQSSPEGQQIVRETSLDIQPNPNRSTVSYESDWQQYRDNRNQPLDLPVHLGLTGYDLINYKAGGAGYNPHYQKTLHGLSTSDVLFGKVRTDNMNRLLDEHPEIYQAFKEGQDIAGYGTASLLLAPGAMNAITNPLATTIGVATGEAGAGVVNKTMQLTTGKDWGHNFSRVWNSVMPDKLHISPGVAAWSNPGSMVGISKFISPARASMSAFPTNGKVSDYVAYGINKSLPYLDEYSRAALKLAAERLTSMSKGYGQLPTLNIFKPRGTYAGAATPSGNFGDSRNLITLGLYGDNSILRGTRKYQNTASAFTPSVGGPEIPPFYRYLYPGVENRRYQMRTLTEGEPLHFNSQQELDDYAKVGVYNPKENGFNIEVGDSDYMHIGGNSLVQSIDDIAGHNAVRQDNGIWHFDINKYWPGDFQGRHGGNINHTAIMDQLFEPYILQQFNPIEIHKDGGNLIPVEGIIPIEYNKLERYNFNPEEQTNWWEDLDTSEIGSAFSPYEFPESKPMILEAPEDIATVYGPTTPSVTTQFNPTNRQEFVTTLYPIISKSLQKYGLDAAKWTNYLLAHMAIESGWGKSSLATQYNNFGGIKGKDTPALQTKEWSQDRGYYTIQDKFKAFDSIEQYADYYVERLKNKFHAFDGDTNQYLSNIKSNGYFTAPLHEYSKIFNSVLTTINTYVSTISSN